MWIQYQKRTMKNYIDELFGDNGTVCISCGYTGEDIQGDDPDLYDGCGCPQCKSPLVMVKATDRVEIT